MAAAPADSKSSPAAMSEAAVRAEDEDDEAAENEGLSVAAPPESPAALPTPTLPIPPLLSPISLPVPLELPKPIPLFILPPLPIMLAFSPSSPALRLALAARRAATVDAAANRPTHGEADAHAL